MMPYKVSNYECRIATEEFMMMMMMMMVLENGFKSEWLNRKKANFIEEDETFQTYGSRLKKSFSVDNK